MIILDISRCFVGVFRAILHQQLVYCPFFTQTLVNHAKSCPKGTILKGLDIKFLSHAYIHLITCQSISLSNDTSWCTYLDPSRRAKRMVSGCYEVTQLEEARFGFFDATSISYMLHLVKKIGVSFVEQCAI